MRLLEPVRKLLPAMPPLSEFFPSGAIQDSIPLPIVETGRRFGPGNGMVGAVLARYAARVDDPKWFLRQRVRPNLALLRPA